MKIATKSRINEKFYFKVKKAFVIRKLKFLSKRPWQNASGKFKIHNENCQTYPMAFSNFHREF
jgi:hypothetical protein